MLRVLFRLPLASLAGCALAVLASFALIVRGPAVDGAVGTHLFSAFALFAILGLWIDWARLYPASRRTVFVSALAFVTTLLVALAGVTLDAVHIAVATPFAAALAIPLAARAFFWLAARGRSDWAILSGEVRHEEGERLVLVSAAGDVIALDRGSAELGSCRTVDVGVGSPLAVLARLDTAMAPDPYRSEARLGASQILAAAPDPSALRRRLYARARHWAFYACLLVPVAWLAAVALTLDVASCGVPEIYAQ